MEGILNDHIKVNMVKKILILVNILTKSAVNFILIPLKKVIHYVVFLNFIYSKLAEVNIHVRVSVVVNPIMRVFLIYIY